MALNIPKVMQTFTQGSVDVQRLYNNVSQAVNPVLKFLGDSFVAAGNNVLRILPDVQIGNLTTRTSAVTGNQSIAGNQSVSGATVSSTGFKFAVDMGTAWSSAATVGTRYRTKVFAQNDGATGTFNNFVLFQTPFAGSLVGAVLWSTGQGGGNAFLQVFKNTNLSSNNPTGTAIIDTNFTPGNAGQYFGSYQTYAKGLYPFAAGDYFVTSCSFATAGNQFMQVRLFFELNA